MRILHVVYWLITGALLGLGLVEFAGDGLIILPIGVVLLLIGLFALRGREVVAGVVGFGAVPEADFVHGIIVAQPPPGAAPFYYGGAILFGVITVAGLVALVVTWGAKRSGSGPATT